MKKLLIAIIALLGVSAVSFAQTATPKDTKAAKTTAKKETAKTATATTASATTATAAKTTTAGPTKKDGTPDKRYKANKDADKAATTHVKKDGTPDKRYKENKDKKQ